MPTDDVQRLVTGTASAPATFTIPGNGQIQPKTVFASYDGTAAVLPFLPALKITSDAGKFIGVYASTTQVASGGTADVSWFPWRRVKESAPAPSPNPLGTLWAWYDFSDTSSWAADGAGNIRNVTDKTGNGHDLAQTDAAHRPGVTVVNGLDAALCSSATFTWLGSSVATPGLPTPYTILAVWTSPAALSHNHFPGATGTFDTNHTGAMFQNNDTGHIFLQTNAASIVSNVVNAPFGQFQTTGIVDGVNSSLRINGASTAGNLTGTPTLLQLALGAAHIPDDSPFFSGLDGAVCEVLYYSEHLSAAQLSAVESYLKAKWGTP